MAQQSSAPFFSIPEAPSTMNAAHSLVRMVQGLGYRYHWASKNLRSKDLNYKPSDQAASCFETLQHIYGLSDMIANATQSIPSERPMDEMPTEYDDLRILTLERLKIAETNLLAANDDVVAEMKVIIQRGKKTYSFPIWNLINGPLSDALYHTGQVVSFRRTTGNPIDSGVNVFLGKTKE